MEGDGLERSKASRLTAIAAWWSLGVDVAAHRIGDPIPLPDASAGSMHLPFQSGLRRIAGSRAFATAGCVAARGLSPDVTKSQRGRPSVYLRCWALTAGGGVASRYGHPDGSVPGVRREGRSVTGTNRLKTPPHEGVFVNLAGSEYGVTETFDDVGLRSTC